MPSRQNASATTRKPLQTDLRTDGRRKRRPPLEPLKRNSIDAGAAYCFGEVRSSGVLARPKETTRKLYRDAYEAFRRCLADAGLGPAVDNWSRLLPNVRAAVYGWYLDHTARPYERAHRH